MNHRPVVHVAGSRRTTWRLPAPASFVLLTTLIAVFPAASTAVTPLYPVYATEWALSPLTTTVVFSVYVVGALLTLLTAGSLSDHVGRRPLLFAALLLEGVVMVLLLTASGPVALIAGRFLQGVATGAAAGAVGAALVDLDPARGATVNSVGPAAGTAVGPLAGGAIAQLLPDPTQLVYVVLLLILAIQAALLLLTVETARRRSGALASLRPTVALPPGPGDPSLCRCRP
ncbi:MAG: MFS transporter [Candidatus Dormibacteraceae bacterium]